MRSFTLLALTFAIPITVPAITERTVARVERIDPITQVAEIRTKEPLALDREYHVISDRGEKLGRATKLNLKKTGAYAFVFVPQRRKLSAGRRITLEAAESNFSALADRPRTQKDSQIGFELRDKVPMRHIPEGLFVLGSQETRALHFVPAELNGRKVNRMDLTGFFIDEHEVTVAQYQRYLEETRVKIPEDLLRERPNAPLTHMTYREAEAYCSWTAKRLPTEFEWEKAARGTSIETQADETFTDLKAFAAAPADCVTSESASSAREVDGLKDRNGFGLVGMCGNAAEWTQSWLMPYRGNTQSDERFGKRYKVIRGGSFEEPLENAKSYTRMAGGIPSLSTDRRAGFRCARSE